MPLIKIDSSYFSVHPELSKRIEILSRISQSDGKLKSYTEDYPHLAMLLLNGNHIGQQVGGYISLAASVLDGEETVAEMEVVVAFDAADNTLLFSDEGDYVIGKCPPNDKPLEDEENAPATVLVLETKQALLDHLKINE
jgi:hypothetical protein